MERFFEVTPASSLHKEWFEFYKLLEDESA